MKFWGRVTGTTGDYLVAFGLPANMAAPAKVWFFATTKQLVLQQMPDLSEPFAKLAASMAGARFLGQPGKLLGPDADAAEEEEQLDEAGNPKPKAPRFSEAHRLAFTVAAVDRDTAVVPRGAFVVSPTHHVAASPLFAGLAGAEAGALANYCHFRPAEHPSRAHALNKAGVVPATDFLDPCSEDAPRGVWSLRVDPGRGLAELRSLKWPGYFGYHLVGTPKFGAAYFGDGVENTSLQFML